MHTVSLAIFSLVEDIDLLVSLNNNKIKILDAREKKKQKIFNFLIIFSRNLVRKKGKFAYIILTISFFVFFEGK